METEIREGNQCETYSYEETKSSSKRWGQWRKTRPVVLQLQFPVEKGWLDVVLGMY